MCRRIRAMRWNKLERHHLLCDRGDLHGVERGATDTRQQVPATFRFRVFLPALFFRPRMKLGEYMFGQRVASSTWLIASDAFYRIE